MTTRTTLDALNVEQHGPDKFDLVSVTDPDRQNEDGETIWQRESSATSLDPNEQMPVLRLLAIGASDPDGVRRRLRELGYSEEGF